MRRILLALILFLLGTPAYAQQVNLYCFVSGSTGLNAWQPCSSANALNVTGTVTVAPGNAVGITPTDHTITSATGASQTMMNANPSRHSLTIENTGNANCGVNPTGGTAAIGGAGTLTLQPFGAYTPRIPSLSASHHLPYFLGRVKPQPSGRSHSVPQQRIRLWRTKAT